jgi:signal transduction histidine kinase
MSSESLVPTNRSVTLGDVSSPPQREPVKRSYGALWRAVPRDLGFLVLTLPVAYIGFSVLNGILWAGIGTLIIYIGVFLVAGSLYVARGFGALELVRLRWAGEQQITPPTWNPDGKPVTFWRGVFGPYRNRHYWLYLLHALIINPLISTISWCVTITWVAVGLGGTTYWFWDRFIPQGNHEFYLSKVIYEFMIPGSTAPFNPTTGDNVLEFVFGIIFLFTLPFITRGMTRMHLAVARGVLGAGRAEALQREVADLAASRGAAVVAEDQSLRRLERDLHDGPQQRLIRLQMDLASAERKLDADPEAARALLAEAGRQANDTLEELRALSRGLAPPILQDRGLVAALDSLAARSTVPIAFESRLSPETRLPAEIERSAYYIAAELVANVAKHSRASSASLFVELRNDAAGGSARLDLSVTDNGIGGAALVTDHGLSGLDERVRGLRGELVLDSPAGGPTRISVRIPVPAPSAAPAETKSSES